MAATNSSERMKQILKGSIANQEAAEALADLFDKFNDLLVKIDADRAHINAVLAKLDADAGVTDVDYASTNTVDVDYSSTLDVDSDI